MVSFMAFWYLKAIRASYLQVGHLQHQASEKTGNPSQQESSSVIEVFGCCLFRHGCTEEGPQ